MSSLHPDIRYAAEAMYRNAHHSSPGFGRVELTRSHARLDLLNALNENYIAGYADAGRMSVVRRFFCLFVVFDVFFISLLWLICVMMHGDTIPHAFDVQIRHYAIQTSLFDIVTIAIMRFILLISFYGLFQLNHWIIIAFTTSGSCSFLIAKVFYYNWMVSSEPIIQVLMIIVSCLLAWGEAWFLDCRVIPQEKYAHLVYNAVVQGSENERSPLLHPYFRDIRSEPDTSVGNFYSPIGSESSESEDEAEFEELKTIGIENVCKGYELLMATDWKHEKLNEKTGDRIQSLHCKDIGKIFRLTAQIQYPAKELLLNLFNDYDRLPEWNPTVLQSKILKHIDKYTDITYQVSAPAGGGIVASRDFVILRCWKVICNGEIVDDDITISSEDGMKPHRNESMSQSQPALIPANTSQLRKTASVDDLHDEIEEVRSKTTLFSLSKSLGAKVFTNDSDADDTFCSANLTRSTDTNRDEYVDAKETQSATTMSVNTINSSNRSAYDIYADKLYIMNSASIKYDHLPRSKYIRGETRIACIAIRDSKEHPNTCIFDWMLCLDLKGLFMRSVLDRAYTSVMQEFMTHLRKYCRELEHKT